MSPFRWLALTHIVGCLCVGTYSSLFRFEDVYPAARIISSNSIPSGAVLASSLVGQPVYVSMTTMSSRIGNVHKTIRQIFGGRVIPDRLFLFISREPFLLDRGIANDSVIPSDLRDLALKGVYPLSVIYTDNLGSHRKLLPLLAKKWEEDCIIATFDDEPKDEGKLGQYLSQLIKYYLASNRSAVVSLKARRIGLCRSSPWLSRNYGYWQVTSAGKHELFLLPTGTGSVLYRPRFFHPIVFDSRLRNLTATADDLMFRLSAMVRGTRVVTGCRDSYARDRDTGLLSVTRCPDAAVIGGPGGASPPAPPSERGRGRRRLIGSLAQLNLHKKGNDWAWANASLYLQDLGLLNLTALAERVMPFERGPECDPKTWDSVPLRGRRDALGKELQRQRRECALTICRPTSV
jgi:hypothetical protein